jgi:hypothetical protein
MKPLYEIGALVRSRSTLQVRFGGMAMITEISKAYIRIYEIKTTKKFTYLKYDFEDYFIFL